MKEIHITLATDENFLKQTCITIESALMARKSEVIYHFYVFMRGDEENDVGRYFLEIEKKYDACIVEKLEVGDLLGEVSVHIEHITSPTYYRLLATELVKSDKCIYLDSDVIVCRDLVEMYEIPIQGYAIAGVIAPSYHKLAEKEKEYIKQTGIPTMQQYINAGVLLMNLDEMRRMDFVFEIKKLVQEYFPAQDQDIINRLAYNKIKMLPLRYNLQITCLKWEKDRLKDVFTREELEEAMQNPYIIHYSTAQKPWEYLDIKYAEHWWDVCWKSILRDEVFEQYRNVIYYYAVVTKKKLWQCKEHSTEWLEEIRKYASIYVYGAGIRGKRAVPYLKEKQITIDNVLVSELKAEDDKVLCDVSVKQFAEDVKKDSLILLAVSERFEVPIRRMLLAKGYFNVWVLKDI